MAGELDAAKKKANGLLSQMLPKSVSKQLLEGQHVKAQSFEYDDSTEVHTVQVSKQHSSIGGSPWVRTLPTFLDPNCAI